MWGHLVQVWQNIRIISNYTATQIKALSRLQELSVRYLAPMDLKNTLLATDANGIPTESSQKLANELMHIMRREIEDKDSPLATYANSLLLNIAQYLYKKNKAHMNTGYPNDPINLLALQVAFWLKTRLLTCECKVETFNEISQWIKYLEAVVLDNDILSFDEQLNVSSSDTAKVMFTNIKNILEEVREYIGIELKRVTIKEQFNSLVNHGKNYIENCFLFIFYILQDIPSPPRNFTIVNINMCGKTNLTTDIDDVINKTVLGSYLGCLALTPSISELYFPNRFQNRQKISSRLIEDTVASCPLLNNSEQKDKVIQNILKQSDLIEKQSGIIFASKGEYISPKMHAETRQSFILLCGYLEVFARVLLLCREAAYLSSANGDIITCEKGKDQLDYLVSSFRQLSNGIMLHCKRLKDCAIDLQQVLVSKKIKDTSWQATLSEGIANFNTLEHTYDNSFHPHLSNIDTSIRNVIERKKQMARRQEFFVQDINRMKTAHPWLAPQAQINSSSAQCVVIEEEEARVHVPENHNAVRQIKLKSPEEPKLSRFSAEYGYTCIDAPRDGDCFYHAVAYLLINQKYKKEDKLLQEAMARLIRTFVAKHADEHLGEYLDIGGIKRSRNELMDHIYREWADELHALLTSRVLNITIVILRSNGTINILKRANPSHIIYLGFIPELHYMSLVKNNSVEPKLQFQGHIEKKESDDFKATCYLEELFRVTQNEVVGILTQEIKPHFYSGELLRQILESYAGRESGLLKQYKELKDMWRVSSNLYNRLANVPDNIRRRAKERMDAEINKIEKGIEGFCGKPELQRFYKAWKVLHEQSVPREKKQIKEDDAQVIPDLLRQNDIESSVLAEESKDSEREIMVQQPEQGSEIKNPFEPNVVAISNPQSDSEVLAKFFGYGATLSLFCGFIYYNRSHRLIAPVLNRLPFLAPRIKDYHTEKVGNMASKLSPQLLTWLSLPAAGTVITRKLINRTRNLTTATKPATRNPEGKADSEVRKAETDGEEKLKNLGDVQVVSPMSPVVAAQPSEATIILPCNSMPDLFEEDDGFDRVMTSRIRSVSL